MEIRSSLNPKLSYLKQTYWDWTDINVLDDSYRSFGFERGEIFDNSADCQKGDPEPWR